jgi:hypothetical protein
MTMESNATDQPESRMDMTGCGRVVEVRGEEKLFEWMTEFGM